LLRATITTMLEATHGFDDCHPFADGVLLPHQVLGELTVQHGLDIDNPNWDRFPAQNVTGCQETPLTEDKFFVGRDADGLQQPVSHRFRQILQVAMVLADTIANLDVRNQNMLNVHKSSPVVMSGRTGSAKGRTPGAKK
jgi:hypothetical protein